MKVNETGETLWLDMDGWGNGENVHTGYVIWSDRWQLLFEGIKEEGAVMEDVKWLREKQFQYANEAVKTDLYVTWKIAFPHMRQNWYLKRRENVLF